MTNEQEQRLSKMLNDARGLLFKAQAMARNAGSWKEAMRAKWAHRKAKAAYDKFGKERKRVANMQ